MNFDTGILERFNNNSCELSALVNYLLIIVLKQMVIELTWFDLLCALIWDTLGRFFYPLFLDQKFSNLYYISAPYFYY